MRPNKQFDLVAHGRQGTRPIMGCPAGFHQHPADRRLGHELDELFPVETMTFTDASFAIRNRDLETIFCQIDAEGSTLHIGLLLFDRWVCCHFQLGTSMPKKQEESISSFKLPVWLAGTSHRFAASRPLIQALG